MAELDPELPAVVCISTGDDTFFIDNVRGVCCLCGAGVQHRPHIPQPSQLVCIPCWLGLVQDGDTIEVMPETIAELRLFLMKAQKVS